MPKMKFDRTRGRRFPSSRNNTPSPASTTVRMSKCHPSAEPRATTWTPPSIAIEAVTAVSYTSRNFAMFAARGSRDGYHCIPR
jgi:hypothetical protein